jgi:plastocyanin
MSMTPLRTALMVAALGSLIAGCAGATGADASPVATSEVNLPPSYRFDPPAITVPDGTTVTWTNSDNFTHNVRLLDDGGDILALPPGETVSFTFHGAGEHRYDCSFHPNDMSGVVVVTDG